MPYADPEKRREASRAYKAKMRQDPKWRKVTNAKKRAYNRTEAGKESNRRAMRRWWRKHYGNVTAES